LILDRIRGEFREMPGLALTVEQARRLWSLDAPTCHEALAYLVETGFLSLKPNGAYARASDLTIGDRSFRMARTTIDTLEVKQSAPPFPLTPPPTTY
jgi:DNA-binding IclR family transcriptional regulator